MIYSYNIYTHIHHHYNGTYGQLGRDNAWDDAKPSVLIGLMNVQMIAAGECSVV